MQVAVGNLVHTPLWVFALLAYLIRQAGRRAGRTRSGGC